MLPKSQIVLLTTILAALGLSAFANRFDPYVLDVALYVAVNITLAVSLNLINGFTGQFSLGHAGFMAIGAYASAVITTTYASKWLPVFGGHVWLLFPSAMLVAGLAAAAAGFAVGAPSLRLRGDYLAIVTLGFGEIIRVLLQNWKTGGAALGLSGIPSYTTPFWAFTIAAITIYTVWALVQSTYGRGFLAVADDEVAAEAMGLNSTRFKIIAFVVGAFFAGVAGALYAHLKGFITPTGFDFNRSIEIVVMVILGGMGRHLGVIAAAIILTLLSEWLREYGQYRMIIYSTILIVLMIARPQGLFIWPLWQRKSP